MATAKGSRHKILEILSRHDEELSGADLLRIDPTLAEGTVYTTLSRLERDGLVTSRVEKIPGEQNRPRRFFALTSLGLSALERVDTPARRPLTFTGTPPKPVSSIPKLTSVDQVVRELKAITIALEQLQSSIENQREYQRHLIEHLANMAELRAIPSELFSALSAEQLDVLNVTIVKRLRQKKGGRPPVKIRLHGIDITIDPNNADDMRRYGDLVEQLGNASSSGERVIAIAELKKRIRQQPDFKDLDKQSASADDVQPDEDPDPKTSPLRK